MTYFSYDELKSLLELKGVEFTEPTPSCPKHLNYVCMDMAGKCSEGNSRNCSQDCSFMYKKRFFQFHVLYTSERMTRLDSFDWRTGASRICSLGA